MCVLKLFKSNNLSVLSEFILFANLLSLSTTNLHNGLKLIFLICFLMFTIFNLLDLIQIKCIFSMIIAITFVFQQFIFYLIFDLNTSSLMVVLFVAILIGLKLMIKLQEINCKLNDDLESSIKKSNEKVLKIKVLNVLSSWIFIMLFILKTFMLICKSIIFGTFLISIMINNPFDLKIVQPFLSLIISYAFEFLVLFLIYTSIYNPIYDSHLSILLFTITWLFYLIITIELINFHLILMVYSIGLTLGFVCLAKFNGRQIQIE